MRPNCKKQPRIFSDFGTHISLIQNKGIEIIECFREQLLMLFPTADTSADGMIKEEKQIYFFHHQWIHFTSLETLKVNLAIQQFPNFNSKAMLKSVDKSSVSSLIFSKLVLKLEEVIYLSIFQNPFLHLPLNLPFTCPFSTLVFSHRILEHR